MRSRKLFVRVTLAALVLSVSLGCAGSKQPTGLPTTALLEVTPTSGERVTPDTRREYRLKSGDRVAIRVLTDSSLGSAAEVQTDGRITIPWVGTVPASGLTVEELRQSIETSLASFLRRPAVAVSIESFGPSRVFVTGEVRVPGAYSIEAGQTVLGAIAAAGGLLTTANADDVLLLRRVNDLQASVHQVNIKRVLRGEGDFGDPLVQHLDIIHVPRTFIADVGIFVDQFFNRMRPAFAFYLDGWEAFNLDKVQVISGSRFIR